MSTPHLSSTTSLSSLEQTQPPSYKAPSALQPRYRGQKTRLSICKDGGVVAFEAAVDQLLGAGGVDGVLLGVHVEQIVIGEGLVFPQDHLRLPGHHICTDVTSLDFLPGQLRTNPKENTETRDEIFCFLCIPWFEK